MNPYEVLGLPSSASPAEVKRAYRRLLKRHHPDACGFPPGSPAWEAAHQKTIELHAAYAMLRQGGAAAAPGGADRSGGSPPAAASPAAPNGRTADAAAQSPSSPAAAAAAARFGAASPAVLRAARLIGRRCVDELSASELRVWRAYLGSSRNVYLPHPLAYLAVRDRLCVGVVLMLYAFFLVSVLAFPLWAAAAVWTAATAGWVSLRRPVRRCLSASFGVAPEGFYITPDGVVTVVGRELMFFPKEAVRRIVLEAVGETFYQNLLPVGRRLHLAQVFFDGLYMARASAPDIVGASVSGAAVVEPYTLLAFDVAVPAGGVDLSAQLRRVWATDAPPAAVTWATRFAPPAGLAAARRFLLYSLVSVFLVGASTGSLYLRFRSAGVGSAGDGRAAELFGVRFGDAAAWSEAVLAAWFRSRTPGVLAGAASGDRAPLTLQMVADYPDYVLVLLYAEEAAPPGRRVVVGLSPRRPVEVALPSGRYQLLCFVATPDHPQEKFQAYRKRIPLTATARANRLQILIGGATWRDFERVSPAAAAELLPSPPASR